MRICEVMSSPVVTVQPDTQLKDVAATLVEHGINAAPVIDASDRLVGIVSEADLLSLEPPPGPGSVSSWASRHTAREVMSQSVHTCPRSPTRPPPHECCSRPQWSPATGSAWSLAVTCCAWSPVATTTPAPTSKPASGRNSNSCNGCGSSSPTVSSPSPGPGSWPAAGRGPPGARRGRGPIADGNGRVER